MAGQFCATVACCRFIVWSWTARLRGHLLALPFRDDRCANDQGADFLCLVNEKSFFFICSQGEMGGGGDWSQMLQIQCQLYNLVTGHITCYIFSRTCYITLALCYIHPSLYNRDIYNFFFVHVVFHD